MDAVARDDEMDAFRGADLDAAAAGHLLDGVGPDARRVDDPARPQLDVVAGLEVAEANAARPGLSVERGRSTRALVASTGTVRAAVRAERQRVARVVDLGVEVPDRRRSASRA